MVSQCYLKVHGSPTLEKVILDNMNKVAVLSKSAWFSYKEIKMPESGNIVAVLSKSAWFSYIPRVKV